MTRPTIVNGTGNELIQDVEEIEQKLTDMSVLKYRHILKIYPLARIYMSDSLQEIREFLDLLKHEEGLGHFDYQPADYSEG